jgi:hypothetical protein
LKIKRMQEYAHILPFPMKLNGFKIWTHPKEVGLSESSEHKAVYVPKHLLPEEFVKKGNEIYKNTVWDGFLHVTYYGESYFGSSGFIKDVNIFYYHMATSVTRTCSYAHLPTDSDLFFLGSPPEKTFQ